MPKCKRLFGLIGMCHVQAILLSWTYAVDALLEHALHEIVANIEGPHNRARLYVNDPADHLNEQGTAMRYIHSWKYGVIAVGRLACAPLIPKINNKLLLLGAIIVEVLFILAAKSIDKKGGIHWLLAFLLTASFIKSAVYPLTLNILSQWAQTTQMTLVYAIYEGSKVVLLSLALILVDNLKRAGYSELNVHLYTTVAVKLMFVCLYMVFGSQDPSSNPFISPEELADLKRNKPRWLRTRWKNGIPWRGIFTTSILYGCIISDIAFAWGHDLEGVDKVDMLAGYINSRHVYKLICFYLYIISCLINAAVVDFVIKKTGMTYRNNIRKTMCSITAWGSGSCLLLVGYTLGKPAIYLWLGVYHILKVANFYNDSLLVVYEVSPNYFAVSYALISSVANLTRTLKPTVESLLGSKGLEGILYFHSFLMIFCTLFMTLFGSCRLRNHDSYGTIEWKDESFISFP